VHTSEGRDWFLGVNLVTNIFRSRSIIHLRVIYEFISPF